MIEYFKGMHFTFILRILLTLVFLRSFIPCSGHEMCATGLPLTKMKAPLQFCSSVSGEYGCCTEQYDGTIKTHFNDVMLEIPSKLGDECAPYIKEMLCHVCHPLSGHSFESAVKHEIPGLCPKYCQEFFKKCEMVIQYFGKQSKKIYHQSNNSTVFCKKVETEDIGYCFPEVKTNSELMLETSANDVESKTSVIECVCFKQFEGKGINPVKMEELKDGSGRLLVAELSGVISLFHANGTKEKKPFLDLEDYINRKDFKDQVTSFGLPSFALHPLFKSNGKLYITYAKMIQGKLFRRLSEFIMTSPIKPESTERILIEIQPPHYWHNINDLFFGIDGYLYIFSGDGGIQGDPHMIAQNGTTFHGKVLRIDVNTKSDSRQYGIPPDNPFVNDKSFAPEVFAYGLRNPWRCVQDSGDPVTGEGKGRIFCGDVGYNKYEEIDIIRKGGNYGWNGKEGFACYESSICNKMENEEFPIAVYDHKNRKSVIGGEVYRGNCIPHLQGKYITGDYMYSRIKGRLNTIRESDDISNTWITEDLQLCELCPPPLTKKLPVRILSFGRDDNGEVYIMATDKHGVKQNTPGYIYKIVKPNMTENCEKKAKDDVNALHSMHVLIHAQDSGTENENDVMEMKKNNIVTSNDIAASGPTAVPVEIDKVKEIITPSFDISPLQFVTNNDLSTKTAPSLNDNEDTASLVSLSIASGHKNAESLPSETSTATSHLSKEMSLLLVQSTAITKIDTDVKQDIGGTLIHDKDLLLDQKSIANQPKQDKRIDQNEQNVDTNLQIPKIGESYTRNGSSSNNAHIQGFVKFLILAIMKLIVF